jgi:hypothetical protein
MKPKIRMDSFIRSIPEANLENWLWWLSFLAFVLPALGGLFFAFVSYMALRVNDRISEVKATAEAHRTELAEKNEQAIEAQRKREAEEHKVAVSNLERQLEDAEKKVAAVEKFQAQRRLTEDQKTAIIAAISPFRGQKIVVSSSLGDEEARTYRDDFARVFEAAGWDHQGDHGLEQAIFAREVTGIVIYIHQIDGQTGVTNHAINALIKVIGDLNLFEGGGTGVGSDVPSGELKFAIGPKAR